MISANNRKSAPVRQVEMRFASWLREQKMLAGESEYELADAIGVSRMAVYYWLRGSRSPRREILLRICEHYWTDAVALTRQLGVPLLTQHPMTGALAEALFDQAVRLHEEAEFAVDDEAEGLYDRARNILLVVADGAVAPSSKRYVRKLVCQASVRIAGIEQIIDLNPLAVERSARAESIAAELRDSVLKLEALHAKATSLRNCGDTAGALGVLEELVKFSGRDLSGAVLRGCANTLIETGKPVEAEATAEQAMKVIQAEGSPSSIVVGKSTLGRALMATGKLDEAESVLEEALADHYQLGVGPIHRMVTLYPLACLYRRRADELSGAGAKRHAERYQEQVRASLVTAAKVGHKAGLVHQMRKFTASFGEEFEFAKVHAA
jgi:transcriptional regulator with XRE-family HTH domain